MKSKLYKIRNAAREITKEEGARGQVLNNSNHFKPEGLNSISETRMDRDTQFEQLMSMMQAFVQTSDTRQMYAAKSYQVEARDREVLIPLPQIIDNKIASGELKSWIAYVVRTICSSAFNSFFKNQMTFQQTKIYCSQNIFKNIAILSSKYTLNAAEMELIDNHIKNGVLSYLAAKYPLADSTEINKKLQAEIREVDNIEDLSNNYLANSKVVFEYRGSGNYNDLIMQMLNELMSTSDQNQLDGATNYQSFEDFMSTIFERVEDEDWMRKNDKESTMSQLKASYRLSDAVSPAFQEGKDLNREQVVQMKERMRRQAEEKEKYKSKVKEYTHYLISRKIPEDTPPYSQIDIESGNLSIKSPTILRILTKWCEELHQKYSNSYFSNRSESVKVQRGSNVNSLLAWMREVLDEKLEGELKPINEAMSSLFKNNYEMQTNILQHELNLNGDEFIDHIEKISGKLSFKVVKNLHTYIIAYLNQLIHGLLKASKQLFDEDSLFDYTMWPSPPNLLSFRIGDLMRCKCSSKQRQILKIYNQIQRISRETPQILKIIRIKNRLRSGTNDVLMNVRFNNQITCEIQLAIKSKASDFIKCSNAFHHYLYQLQRSIFGPLTELCSIWNSIDPRASIYNELVQEEQFAAAPLSPSQHACATLNNKFEMQPFDKPLLCNLCSQTYHHNNFVRQHVKCNLCGYLLCAHCRINRESQEQLKKSLISSSELRQICKGRVLDDQELPQLGLCICIQSKEPVEQLFTLVTYQKKPYLLGKRNELFVEIFKIGTKKMAKKFRKKFVIFEVEGNTKFQSISEKQAINKYILPQMMRENYKKQKQSINLMDRKLTIGQCQEILSVGSRIQKETVKNLFLADNKIERLPFDQYDFPNLQWMTFSRNTIKNIEGVQFIQNLKKFIGVSCGFSEIPPQFYDCQSLEQLNLPTNMITRIDDRISSMKNLLYLELSNNRITEIPESLFQCTTLITLKMDGNQLTAIPENIKKLIKLEVLFLSSNKITEVTSAIGQLVNLRDIYLFKNYSLSSLPDSLRNLTKIAMLDISYTKIADIPSPAQGWPNIRLINIEATLINALPTALISQEKLQILIINKVDKFKFPQQGNYKGLKVLERKNVCAVDFPSCISKMTQLTTLYYNGNQLDQISELPVLPALMDLNLSNCKITNLPRIYGFKKLKKINLSYNNNLVLPAEGMEMSQLEQFVCNSSKLTRLPPCMLKWERLSKLNVSSNLIISLFDEEMEKRVVAERLGWPNLKFANLSSNQLQAFPEAILNSVRIQDIRIEYNRIKSIPSNIKRLVQLKRLGMNYNQVVALPSQLGQLPNIAQADFAINKISVVPIFIKDMTKLKNFDLGGMNIQVVQCEQWVLGLKSAYLASLKKITKQLKEKREKRAKEEDSQRQREGARNLEQKNEASLQSNPNFKPQETNP